MNMQPDPDFPNLPYASDAEYATWTNEQQQRRHALEVAEAAKIFADLEASSPDSLEVTERVPVPRANRAGKSQVRLRSLYQT
jgi:hypothetical protein